MTALAARRRRTTIVAAITAVVAVLIAGALFTIGAVALFNSTDGADATDDRVESRFAATPNGLLAGVDETGQLASVAVLTLRPGGRGGSIVTLPVNADASSGHGADRLPLDETVALQGSEVLEREAESLLQIDLDRADVVTADELEALLAPLGEHDVLDVDLPIDVVDGQGRTVARAGRQSMSAADAAAVLTARDPNTPAAQQLPAAEAVWSAVAAASGDGASLPAEGAAGDGEAAGADASSVEPATLADLFGQLTAGDVGHRALGWRPFAAERNPRHVDVVGVDAAEISLVFGQISPGQMSAPNPSLSFRVESQFDDDQLAGTGATNADVAFSALQRLVFIGGNVISVSTAAASAPEVTTIHIADESMRAGVESGAPPLLGEVEVVLAEERITGVDAVIELGESFLAELEASGSSGPTSTPSTTGTTIDEERG
jgi:hypothetical protein